MKKNQTRVFTGIVVILAAIAAGYVLFRGNSNVPAQNGNNDQNDPGQVVNREPGVESILVEEGNIVASGNGLSRVELWYVPTGTGVTGAQHQKVGDMAKSSDGDWTLPIPSRAFTATEVYAKGYSEDGTEYRASFGATGATEIYNAIWGTPPTAEKELDPGETLTLGALTLTFTSVASDSRCAPDVQCIQAGNVVANIRLAANGTAVDRTVATNKGLIYGGYMITITDVSPDPLASTEQRDLASYGVTFKITQMIQR